MNVSPVSSSVGHASTPALPADRSRPTSDEDVKKVAEQFEAILVRQFLKPAIEPLMSGGMGGAGGAGSMAGSGGGIYGYMLTDVLATSLSSSGQFGFARMLEHQLRPDGAPDAAAGGTPDETLP